MLSFLSRGQTLMKLNAIFILGAIVGVAQAQTFTDSFQYAAGANIHGLTSPTGLTWGSHNLASNDKNTVTSTGLSYADAGYSQYSASGEALEVSSEGAAPPNWLPTGHVSMAYSWKPSTLGRTVYASFLTKPTHGNASIQSLYFDGGALIGTGNGAFISGFYMKNGKYTIQAYDSSLQIFPEVVTSKSSVLGQTDLVLVKLEQDLPGGLVRFSLAVNPVFGAADPVWDGVVTAKLGYSSSFRAEFSANHYDGMQVARVQYDEIRFGSNLASVTPVPEPSTLLLLGAGIGAFLRRKRS